MPEQLVMSGSNKASAAKTKTRRRRETSPEMTNGTSVDIEDNKWEHTKQLIRLEDLNISTILGNGGSSPVYWAIPGTCPAYLPLFAVYSFSFVYDSTIVHLLVC